MSLHKFIVTLTFFAYHSLAITMHTPQKSTIVSAIVNPLSQAIMGAQLETDNHRKVLLQLHQQHSTQHKIEKTILEIHRIISELKTSLKKVIQDNFSLIAQKEQDGKLPIDYAAICFMPTIMQLLIDHGTPFGKNTAIRFLQEYKIQRYNNPTYDPYISQKPNPYDECIDIIKNNIGDEQWKQLCTQIDLPRASTKNHI